MLTKATRQTYAPPQRESFWRCFARDVLRNKYIYIMAIPMVVYYLLFHYQPMYGAIIAFKNFSPKLGILKSEWAGFTYFASFFKDVFFRRILTNTVMISLYNLIFGFPAPIILALLLNEVRSSIFKRTVQTVCYLPHFISLMVICGMILNFTNSNGIINDVVAFFGGARTSLLLHSRYFRSVYIISDIWQGVGWGSIIYFAALSSIDVQLYEAAIVDGAGRFGQMLHVTLPGIIPTIIIMLVLRIGQLMNVGHEKILLLYNNATLETADVISTYVYRKGLLEANYSYSAAVGIFNSAINFTLLIAANRISKALSDSSLW